MADHKKGILYCVALPIVIVCIIVYIVKNYGHLILPQRTFKLPKPKKFKFKNLNKKRRIKV